MRPIFILIKSTRITWASKSLNMFILALTYAFFSGWAIQNQLEILGGLILVCVLWGALYSLNDYTDLESDRNNPQKQNRAFIKDKVNEKWILIFIFSLISTIFLVSWSFFPFVFTLILGLMLINQILYTLPPFRLKNTAWAPLTSTANNSVLRIASCCVLIGNIFIVPPSVYLFMYLASLCTYLLYKEKNGHLTPIIGISSVTILGYLLYTGNMNLIQFAVAIVPSLLAGAPLYLSLFDDKSKMMHIADILYHKVAFLVYATAILYLLADFL